MNEKLRKYMAKLSFNSSFRRKEGFFLAEGPKIASEIDPHFVERVFVTESFLNGPFFPICERMLSRCGFEMISDEDMKRLSDTVSPQGILLLARKHAASSMDEFLGLEKAYRSENMIESPFFILLEAVQDPGNMGTILRSAEAGGASGLIADSGSSGIYSPKTVRASLGAVLRLPVMEVGDLCETADSLKDLGIPIYAACPEAAISYRDIDMRNGFSLLIGNESRGLSEDILEKADLKIAIPMKGRAESLNAAAAASVISFESLRQRER